MKRLLFLCFFLSATVCVAYGDDEILDLSRGNEALDFYKSIPKYDKIILSCHSGPSITIYSDYSVELKDAKSNSTTNSNINFKGVVYWDKAQDCLYINMDGNVSGNYNNEEKIYTTKKNII